MLENLSAAWSRYEVECSDDRKGRAASHAISREMKAVLSRSPAGMQECVVHVVLAASRLDPGGELRDRLRRLIVAAGLDHGDGQVLARYV